MALQPPERSLQRVSDGKMAGRSESRSWCFYRACTWRRGAAHVLLILIFALAILVGTTRAHAMERYTPSPDLERHYSRLARASERIGLPVPCPRGPPERPLDVSDVLERAICNSPQERRAKAAYLAQIAQMKMREQAYWPVISGRGTFGTSESSRKVRDLPLYDSNLSAHDSAGAVDLQLTLIDFGRRGANLDSARELVRAAGADYDTSTQQIMLGAVETYYEAVDATALLAAARRSEESARLILQVAEGRFAGGVGVVTEKLMAQTTLLQSAASRAFAEGRLASASGMLAIMIGLDPATALQINTASDDVPAEDRIEPVSRVLNKALESSPQVQAARSRLAAAEAAVTAAELLGSPSIDLVASMGKSKKNYPSADQDFGIYDSPGDSTDHSWNVQLRLSVPLFSGFSRNNAIGEAIAQVNIRRAELAAAERVLSQEVWQTYQMAVSQLESVRLTYELLGVARESLEAATFRYESGSGSMIEVLNAQTALTNVEQRRVEAFSSWRAARMRLALRMGMEGAEAIAY